LLVSGQSKLLKSNAVDVVFENKSSKVSVCAIVVLNDNTSVVVHDGNKVFQQVVFSKNKISVNVDLISSNVLKVVFVASVDTNNNFSTTRLPDIKLETSEEKEAYSLDNTGMNESAIMLLDIYMHKGAWKYKALSSGFVGGLDPILALYNTSLISSPVIANNESIKVSKRVAEVKKDNDYDESEHEHEHDYIYDSHGEVAGNRKNNSDGNLPSPDLDKAIEIGVNMFKKLLGFGKISVKELKSGVLKFKTKDFLRASIAGSFMVAAADGSIDSSEKKKLLAFIQTDESLSLFDAGDVVSIFKEFESNYEFDNDAGNAQAMKAVSKVAGNKEQSKFLVRMIIAIGASDGDFDKDEQKVVRTICRELSIDPGEFDL